MWSCRIVRRDFRVRTAIFVEVEVDLVVVEADNVSMSEVRIY